MNKTTVNTTAFDASAEDYDSDFTHSTLGRLLRPRVWAKFAQYFSPGDHVLELTCGTGEDAVWLAQQGVYVTATDGSAEMVRQTKIKAEQAGAANRVRAAQLSLQEIILGHVSPSSQPHFDGVFSNFGGLNTIDAWPALAEQLAHIVRPGGKAILVPMGPVCPWEIIWYGAHGQFKTAFRRFGDSAPATIGDAVIPIWYPSAGQLKRAFAPWFAPLQTESLGLWLPPSYLDHFVNRRPGLFNKLNQFEKATARLTPGWGDHYVVVFERRDD